MKELTKDEAIVFLEELSNQILFPFKFVNELFQYRFTPVKLGIYFLNIFNLAALFTPHLIYYFRQYSQDVFWNLFIYIVLILFSLLTVYLLVFQLPSNELVVNSTQGSIELRPQDLIGKRMKKVVQLTIEDVDHIGQLRIKTKSKTEIYLTLEMKDKTRYRLFAFTNWENISKLKAAFSAIIFNKIMPYDDSNEASVIFDNKIAELAKEEVSGDGLK